MSTLNPDCASCGRPMIDHGARGSVACGRFVGADAPDTEARAAFDTEARDLLDDGPAPGRRCPGCGVGRDTDGDGDCPTCPTPGAPPSGLVDEMLRPPPPLAALGTVQVIDAPPGSLVLLSLPPAPAALWRPFVDRVRGHLCPRGVTVAVFLEATHAPGVTVVHGAGSPVVDHAEAVRALIGRRVKVRHLDREALLGRASEAPPTVDRVYVLTDVVFRSLEVAGIPKGVVVAIDVRAGETGPTVRIAWHDVQRINAADEGSAPT